MDAVGFSAVAKSLLAAARSLALTAPVAFRSPPRKAGETRTLRRTGEGSVVVSVAIRGRSDAEVILDLVAGILTANGQPDAATNRELLLEAAWSVHPGWLDDPAATREALGLNPRPAEIANPPCLADADAFAPGQF